MAQVVQLSERKQVDEIVVPTGRNLRPTWDGMERRVADLLDMLTYKRARGSKSERRFINRWLGNITQADGYGNRIAIVREGNEDPTIAWCSHIDTVHRTAGRQHLNIDTKSWITTSDGECLGADCGVGVWIMREMIFAKVPGLYIFHRDEECGGKGSDYIAQSTPELLDNIEHAIAFDRLGFSSVITHQFGGRCCSTDFAKEMCKRLGEYWEEDEYGTFTDTANYTDLVPECTNLSVGYSDQHTKHEKLHLGFACLMLDRMLSTNWNGLPVVRKAGEVEERDWSRHYYGKYHKFSDQYKGTEIDGDDWDKDAADWSDHRYSNFEDRKSSDPHTELGYVVRTYPDAVVAILEDWGISAEDVYSYMGNKR